jgi:CHAT domain-containing protein
VKAALPAGSAIVAFVRYLHYPVGTPAATKGVSPGVPTPSYLAFVLKAGDPGASAVVPLGPARVLDDRIATWRKQMTSVAMAGGRSTRRAEAALRRTGAELRATIWDSLAPHLEGLGRVFIVPDGPLHLVNWEALPGKGNAYLIEQAPLLHYLSTERDLLPAEQGASGRGLLVIDSPVFDEPPSPATRVATGGSGAAPPEARVAGGTFRGARSACGDFRSMRFDPLPASAREAEAIARIWRQTSVQGEAPEIGQALLRLSGPTATEAAVKQRVRGTRVLHLATHGFFLGSRCASAAEHVGHSSADQPRPDSAPAENPLLLAGFALSGANRRETAGQEDEDGILTGEEIAALDLRGVELAVLSACDTGVGEVRAGEGVLGLRRAFQVAGARTVVMSLWPVDDEATRQWMTGVYERRFVRGAGIAEAVRESSLEQLRRRRRTGASTHPFYWAGFIAAGDWR